MKTVLITAYAVHPNKGSEDGMGWNFILQAAVHQTVIAVTRKNNRPAIEQFFAENSHLPHLSRISFQYFDLPKALIFWKKGPLLSVFYFYIWQVSVALWLRSKKWPVDLVHNLNFHNDWTPTFLWILGKPLVWGPIGHHPAIPAAALKPIYGWTSFLKDRFLWLLKNGFWKADPFLQLSIRKSSMILCMNNDVPRQLKLQHNHFTILPSVAAEAMPIDYYQKPMFTILSAGRFVPLKGFDITIQSFARFCQLLTPKERRRVRLKLVGSGPFRKQLEHMIQQTGLHHLIDVQSWLPRAELLSQYTESSVFLFPSHEGAGMVVAEAMRAALPVVCLKNAGPGQLIHPQSTLSVPFTTYEQTVHNLAERLYELFKNEAYYETESQLALSRFQEHLNWNSRASILRDIYNANSTV